ncbi:MAG: sigma-54-dependent Fis family transcriptional regulator [Deltaproteobacteria bacterium]|nr:sigma-54-dependent Fis family transcriptional regulator [Deltaproteobacteria bacterium]
MTEKTRLAVIDDEPTVCQRLKQVFRRSDFEIETFGAGKPALERMAQQPFPLVLTDIRLPDIDGLEILKRVKKEYPGTEVILMTGYATLDQAVEAVKKGAFYYLSKPFTPDQVRAVVNRAQEHIQISSENKKLRKEVFQKIQYEGIVGISPKIKELLAAIDKVSQIDCNVVIQGESGTGKELVARAIHFNSARLSAPFVVFNCGGFSEELIANELFGHEKGAFTGADSTKIGLMEAAQRGTLFMDEIGEMPPTMQVKLLRVIQEKNLLRLGSTKPIDLDIRIISATNRELEKEVELGRFRQDLYYRLKVVLLKVPPLRERKEDIPLLLNHFLLKYNRAYKKKVRGFSRETLETLMKYSFPGNVRELENIVASAVALSEEVLIGPSDLPEDMRQFEVETYGSTQWLSREDNEKEYIRKILETTEYNKIEAARILKMSRTTLWRKILRYGLEKE